LIPIHLFKQNPPTYRENEIQEKWEYDLNTTGWKRTFKNSIADKTTADQETYKPGPLEPTIKVYSSPTPK